MGYQTNRKFFDIFVFIASLIFGLGSFAANAMPNSFAPLVEDLVPAVVNISTTQKIDENVSPFQEFQFNFPPGSPFEGLPDLFEQFKAPNPNSQRQAYSLGSGFIIDKEGYIVTNHHVVEKADEIDVTFSDNTTVSAKVVGRDPKTDIAVLKVNTDKKLPYLTFGDSDEAKVGDWVIAIGNPFGLGGSVSAGIISARARDINSGPFDDYIQTDAAINRGNSGGPLFNTDGEVIGINTAIYSPSGGNVGIGFAAPSAIAQTVIEQLIEHGRTFRGWLGVKIQTVTPEIAESLNLPDQRGALVAEVTPKGPAEKAGIKVGDIIIEFDGETVETMRKLPRMVAERKAESRVTVRILRGTDKKKLSVTLGELEEHESQIDINASESNKDEEEHEGHEFLDMRIMAMNPSLADEWGFEKTQKGMLVTNVTRGTEADKRGIERGDLIISINQNAVSSIKESERMVQKSKAQGKKSVLLLLLKNEETRFIALPIN